MTASHKSRSWIWLWIAAAAIVVATAIFALVRKPQIEQARSVGSEAKEPARAPIFDPADAMLGTDSSISSQEMQLILVATAPGRTRREGTAMLGTNERNPQTYAAGARLVNGASIEEIYADHIVLELDGSRSELAIGKKSLFQKWTSKTRETEATTVGGASSRQPLDTVATSRQDLSEIIRPEPVFDSEGFAGLRIRPGRSRSKLDALGLKSGDIVMFVDGKRMASADAAWQLIDDTLSTGSSIALTIEREGTLSSMILDGAKIIESAAQVNPMELSPPPPPRL